MTTAQLAQLLDTVQATSSNLLITLRSQKLIKDGHSEPPVTVQNIRYSAWGDPIGEIDTRGRPCQ